MLRITIASLAVVAFVQQAPKPPQVEYDAKRDVTTYSTGDVQTQGHSGYGARFEFPGKTLSAPAVISIGFGALRLTHGAGPDQYQALLHWNDVKTVSLAFGGATHDYPATHAYSVSKNKQVLMFLGHALEESLSISLTSPQFRDIAAADTVQVQLGKDTQILKGKSLAPIKKLAACIPAS
jgi:hypothetical protein